MTDVDGALKSYCDCTKGGNHGLNATCLHVQLVTDSADEFGDVLFHGEEPDAFYICTDNLILMFSIASKSGSARHHSPKRTLVSYCKDGWACQSCVKERYTIVNII